MTMDIAPVTARRGKLRREPLSDPAAELAIRAGSI